MRREAIVEAENRRGEKVHRGRRKEMRHNEELDNSRDPGRR